VAEPKRIEYDYTTCNNHIIKYTNSVRELLNDNTLNITITPDDKIQHIHINI